MGAIDPRTGIYHREPPKRKRWKKWRKQPTDKRVKYAAQIAFHARLLAELRAGR